MNAVYATGEARMLAWIDAERQAAEADARALGGLAEPWVGAGERVPAPRVCQPRAAAAVSAVDRLRLRAVS